LSSSALHRHRKHISQALKEARRDTESNAAGDLKVDLLKLAAKAKRLVNRPSVQATLEPPSPVFESYAGLSVINSPTAERTSPVWCDKPVQLAVRSEETLLTIEFRS
jgi:hypothetical protein